METFLGLLNRALFYFTKLRAMLHRFRYTLEVIARFFGAERADCTIRHLELSRTYFHFMRREIFLRGVFAALAPFLSQGNLNCLFGVSPYGGAFFFGKIKRRVGAFLAAIRVKVKKFDLLEVKCLHPCGTEGRGQGTP